MRFSSVVVFILAVLALLAAQQPPAFADDAEVAKQLEEMKKLFEPLHDDGPPVPDDGRTWAQRIEATRISAPQNLKEAQDATRSEDWPRASRAAKRAIADYLFLAMSDGGARQDADFKMMKFSQSLMTNATYHLPGGPLHGSK